jgi:hypothetical protein
MNRIAVALFSNRSQAEPVQRCLAQAGIAAEIHEELWLQKLWFVSRQAAGVRLEVAADQFERTEKLLLSWDTPEGVLRQAIRCPECKSLLVDYPQFARHSVVTNVAAGLLAEVGLVEKDYYCEQCHYTWPKEQTSPERKRAHMAPYYFIEGVQKTPSVASASSFPKNGPKG